jgi:ABC-2 type transport system permease protein
MNKSLQRIRAIVRREVIQLRRDWLTLFLTLAIPVIELFLLAYSATFTIQHLPLAVYDQSHDRRSRELIRSLTNSEYFDVVLYAGSQDEIMQAIDAGQVKAGLVLPLDFSGRIDQNDGSILLLVDGSDSFSLQSAYGAANSIVQAYSLDLVMENIKSQGISSTGLLNQSMLPVTTSVQTLYNPTRQDLVFIIPAVAAMLIQMFAIVGIAMTIVREREWGVAEQLLSTPIRPLENIIGKIIPYLGLTFFELCVIHLLGYFWFHVPFKGSVFLYLLLAFLFIASSLSVGLLISTVATTQKQIQQVTAFILILSFLITGLVFSRIPMPGWTKIIGALLPMTHFIPIARGIMVKGVGISSLWSNVGALGLFTLILFILLPILSRKRMD